MAQTPNPQARSALRSVEQHASFPVQGDVQRHVSLAAAPSFLLSAGSSLGASADGISVSVSFLLLGCWQGTVFDADLHPADIAELSQRIIAADDAAHGLVEVVLVSGERARGEQWVEVGGGGRTRTSLPGDRNAD